jgi:glycosyltransferase involved in cell wall biosynthesis
MDEPRTLISIILPLHNALDFVSEALNRLAALDSSEVEFVLVDDGSTDGTADLVQQFCDARSNAQFVGIAQNVGVARARNSALGVASGEYVWFVDGDDEWSLSALRTLRDATTSRPDLVLFGADRRRTASTPGPRVDSLVPAGSYSTAEVKRFLAEGRVHGFLWSKLIRRRIIPADPFPAQRAQSDFVGVVRILDNARGALVLPDILYHHIERTGSITRSSRPDLRNLRAAHDAFIASAEATEGEFSPSDLKDFAVWFYFLPAVNTAIRHDALPRDIHRLIDEFRAEVSLGDLTRQLKRPKVFVSALAIKLLGSKYPKAYARAQRVARGTHEKNPVFEVTS